MRRAVLFVGEIEAIDLAGRQVMVRHAHGGHEHVLEYDHLVLALGLRNRLIEVLEEADFECAVAQRERLLTRAYPRLSAGMLRLGVYAARELARRGIEIRLGTRVGGVSETANSLSDGTPDIVQLRMDREVARETADAR